MYDWIIAGAGFTGATVADCIETQLGQRVLVVDRRLISGATPMITMMRPA